MERRLTAIMAADMVGYSRLMGEDEQETLGRLKACRKDLIDPCIAAHNGHIVKTTGDGLLVEFASAIQAVQCAFEIQRTMTERNSDVPEDRRITFRVGINIGDIIVDDGDIFGDGVNIAARLERLADPGGICVARNVFNQVKGKVTVGFEDLGERQVKNIAVPIHVFRVQMSSDVGETNTIRRSKKPRLRGWNLAATAIVAILLFGGVTWWQPWVPQIEPASLERMVFPLPEKPSIAVLPFENLSGDPDQEHFADGITEDVITDLSRLPYLFVIARNSSFAYKGKAIKVQKIAEELGIQYVLEGSIQKAGDRVRVTAQLVDAINGHHVWAERYDRTLDDVFGVQDEMTQQIAATLVGYGGRLTDSQLKIARRKPPENLEAYDYYLLGSDHKHRFTKQDMVRARQYYRKAIQLDPNFARAHLGLAWTHSHDLWLGWTDSPERSLALFKEHAQRAVDLDELDAESHLALGLAFFVSDDVERGKAAFERAHELGPNNADVLAILAWNLPATLGRSEQAVDLVERAMRLNPYYPDWYRHALGYAQYHAGRYHDATRVLKMVENVTVETALYLAASSARLDQDDQASAAANEVLRLDPEFSVTQYMKNVGYKDPTAMADLLDGARMAGLPE